VRADGTSNVIAGMAFYAARGVAAERPSLSGGGAAVPRRRSVTAEEIALGNSGGEVDGRKLGADYGGRGAGHI